MRSIRILDLAQWRNGSGLQAHMGLWLFTVLFFLALRLYHEATWFACITGAGAGILGSIYIGVGRHLFLMRNIKALCEGVWHPFP